MKKQELIIKLQTINAQGLATSISVADLIPLIEQLEDETSVKFSEQLIDEIAEQIADDINDSGMDLINEYDLSMSYREVELDSINFSHRDIKGIVIEVIKGITEQS